MRALLCAAAVALPAARGDCTAEMQKDCGSLAGQGQACKQCCVSHKADLQTAGCKGSDMKTFCKGSAPPKPPAPPTPPGPSPPAPGPPSGIPPRKPTTPSAFAVPADVACDLTPDANFTHRTTPTNYFFHMTPDAKKKGVVFVFHGGGGDEYTMLEKVAPARMAVKSIITELGLGVVSPGSADAGSGWDSVMCDGRQAGAKPRTGNKDIANLLQIVADLKSDGAIDDNTPIVTWGFSNGCNPALELRTCGPKQVKLAMCGGTISLMWYGVGAVIGESAVDTVGVDNTTTTPVFLHIGTQDNYKEIPQQWADAWAQSPAGHPPDGVQGNVLSKIYYQEEAFGWLKGIESESCENEPYYLKTDGSDYRQVCGTTSEQHKKLYSYFHDHGYIDDQGLPKTIGTYEPAKGIDKTVLQAAVQAAGLPTDKVTLKNVDGVIRDAYGGHTPSSRCWPQQKAYIRKVLGL